VCEWCVHVDSFALCIVVTVARSNSLELQKRLKMNDLELPKGKFIISFNESSNANPRAAQNNSG